MDFETVALVALVAALVSAAYGLGVYVERRAWNDLIRRGVLPKPRQRVASIEPDKPWPRGA